MNTPHHAAPDPAAGPHARLAELGLTLPGVSAPRGSYVPALRSGNLVFVSGQIPLADGALIQTGKVGADVTPEQAGLAAVDAVAGLDRVVRIVKVTGYVASAPGFTGQPGVINGASDLLTAV